MPRFDMVDISNNNGQISTETFSSMKTRGVKTIIHKLSEGTTYQDPFAKINLETAQKSGMIIHGYHFSRATNMKAAKEEASFAVRCAKIAGLHKGSIIVLDFEANNLGWTINNAITKAFAKVVKSAGYRYDLYTMGSWTNSISINNHGRAGWIANYPNNATGLKLYQHYNAWQWTSGAKFAGSNSRFDVSVDYSGYYTKNQTGHKIRPKRTDKYFTWTPKKLLVKYEISSYKKSSEVGSGKNIIKKFKPGDQLNVKRIIKFKNSKVTRFELKDGTFITGSKDFVTNLYYTTSKHGVAGKTVISIHGTGRYIKPKFNSNNKVDTLPKGTKFDVRKVVKIGETTRLKLSNGMYISGNKQINKLV